MHRTKEVENFLQTVVKLIKTVVFELLLLSSFLLAVYRVFVKELGH